MSEKIVQLNEEVIKGQIKELVRGSVEEALNELLEKEAESLTQAARYERSEARQGYRSGHYDRSLTTTSGDVTLHIPRLKGVSFETAIIERYRRRESSVEEALIKMYLAGVSVRRVEDITEALWGSKVSPATISELNKKAYLHIEDWRNRPLQGGCYPYVYVDGIYLRRNWGGEYENVSVLVAIAVNEDGFREVLGAAEGMKEDKASWVSFFQWLRGRGLDGVKLIVGDKCMGMLEAVGEVFPDAKYQRCTVHFYRNVFSVVPKSKVKIVAKMLKAIHAQESKKASREKAKAVVAELRAMKLKEAAKKVEDGIEETLTYRTSGCVEQSIVLYEYQPTKKAEHAETFLRGFNGWLHADGYQGYHKLPGNIRVVGCWAHARRKFDEALQTLPKEMQKDSPAAIGECYCSRLFKLEQAFAELTPEERYEKRLEQEKPVLDALLSWANEMQAKTAPKSALGRAIHYLLEQWPYLTRYLEDGRLELSNNRAERSMKPFVMGRKNWLFANTPGGAQASAMIYSLIETAKENGLDPYRYLLWILQTAPQLSETNKAWAESLLPANATEECYMSHK